MFNLAFLKYSMHHFPSAHSYPQKDSWRNAFKQLKTKTKRLYNQKNNSWFALHLENWIKQSWLDASLKKAGHIPSLLNHWAKFLELKLLLLPSFYPRMGQNGYVGWPHKPEDKLLSAFAKAEMVPLAKLSLGEKNLKHLTRTDKNIL